MALCRKIKLSCITLLTASLYVYADICLLPGKSVYVGRHMSPAWRVCMCVQAYVSCVASLYVCAGICLPPGKSAAAFQWGGGLTSWQTSRGVHCFLAVGAILARTHVPVQAFIGAHKMMSLLQIASSS